MKIIATAAISTFTAAMAFVPLASAEPGLFTDQDTISIADGQAASVCAIEDAGFNGLPAHDAGVALGIMMTIDKATNSELGAEGVAKVLVLATGRNCIRNLDDLASAAQWLHNNYKTQTV